MADRLSRSPPGPDTSRQTRELVTNPPCNSVRAGNWIERSWTANLHLLQLAALTTTIIESVSPSSRSRPDRQPETTLYFRCLVTGVAWGVEHYIGEPGKPHCPRSTYPNFPLQYKPVLHTNDSRSVSYTHLT